MVGLQEHREATAARIQADRAAIGATLAANPHPDPADLNAEAREGAEERTARREHTARTAAEAAAAAAAARAAFRDRGPLTWLRNVLLDSPTPGQRSLLDAADHAHRNRDTRPDDGTLRAARERGRLLAMGARDRTEAWERRPEVREAHERQRLNTMVDQAAKDGDPAITRALRQGDPEAARMVIREREESERRQQEEQERRMGLQRGPGSPTAPGTGGPRFPGRK